MPPVPHPRRRRDALALLLCLAGCAPGIGPQQLDIDQMGYAEALGEGLKRQMLLNMVRLRYADVPTFLSVSQLIAGYQVQATGQLGLNAYPNAAPGNYATVGGTLQYTNRPTFTFTPVTGQRFAQSYLRPLAPAELLSLAQSGAPVDLLFRIGVQSVNGLANGVTTVGAGPQDPSEGFQALMRTLREVQSAGALTVRFHREPAGGQAHLVLDGDDEGARAAARRVRQLLGLGPEVTEFEVVYGRRRLEPKQVAVLTRSVLQILYELGSQMEVPEADVRRGESRATEAGAPTDPRERLIHVRHGRSAPRDAYAAVEYRDRWFWIDAADYQLQGRLRLRPRPANLGR
jgi:hypothetical protein